MPNANPPFSDLLAKPGHPSPFPDLLDEYVRLATKNRFSVTDSDRYVQLRAMFISCAETVNATSVRYLQEGVSKCLSAHPLSPDGNCYICNPIKPGDSFALAK